MRPFRFGLSAARASSRRDWQDLARRAEAAGFDILHVPDHLDECLPPLAALCTAADATERLQVGTLVNNNDFRHPVLLAREAATVALLTDGRFELGLGVGHMRREYDQAGLPFDPAPTRIARMAESLEIVRRLLDGEELTFAGAHYRIEGHRIYPTPGTRPRLLVGGNGDRLLTVAAERADVVGFTGFNAGRPGGGAISHFTAKGLEQRIGFVRERAGDRFDSLELHALVQHVLFTEDRRRAAEDVAAQFGGTLSAEEALESPFLLIGTPDQMADTLRERRERLGVSYWTVFARRPGRELDLDAFAPVIAALR